jgi:UDP-glucose 4-epimerase
VRFLVTGGAGFIGSHLCDALIERGDEVTVLDVLSTGSIDNITHLIDHPRFSFRHGSVLDPLLVRRVIGETDVVVHLAASVGVQLIVSRPLDSLVNNIRGTEVVLEACAESGRKVLVASTSEIYGKSTSFPLREDSDSVLGSFFKARWSYATAKAVDEILAYTYWRERGTPSIVVRLFNTVGPRQTGAYGMVLPRFVRQALRHDPITVFGTGEQSRCFCHVDDVTAGLLGLLDCREAVGEVFNVGSGREITIAQLAELVTGMTGSSSDIEYIPYEEAYEEGFEDMDRRVPDTSKIADLIGWQPKRQLEEIVADVIEFERDRMQRARAE